MLLIKVISQSKPLLTVHFVCGRMLMTLTTDTIVIYYCLTSSRYVCIYIHINKFNIKNSF